MFALGAVAHGASSERRVCGKVTQVKASETRYTPSMNAGGVSTAASITVAGTEFLTQRSDLAQLALTAKAAGQSVCAVETTSFQESADQGYGSSERKLELIFE